MFNQFSRNWWGVLINGVIALILGLFAIFSPEGTLLTLAKYFGIVVILAGIVLFIGAISRVQKKIPFKWLLVESIIIIILGAIILIFTEESLRIFVGILGIWAIAMGVLQFMLLASIKKEIKDRTTILISAIITLAFGIILFFNPFTAAKIFTILVGVMALAMGILLIYIAFSLKKAQ